MHRTFPCSFLTLLLCASALPAPTTDWGPEAFARLGRKERNDYVARLEARGDIAYLKAIFATGLDEEGRAAAALVPFLDADELLELARSVPVGSHVWSSAFCRLGCHPKEKVLDYIVECAQSDDATAKWFAYSTCSCYGWPDLMDMASSDLDDGRLVIAMRNQDPAAATVGDMARLYIQGIQRTHDIPRSICNNQWVADTIPFLQ